MENLRVYNLKKENENGKHEIKKEKLYGNISKTSPSLYLLRSIRDEVHRYAISFHRKKRDKNMTLSIFEDLNGLGKKRLQELWKNFKSIDDIKKTTVNKITKKTNIPKSIAKQIIKKAKKLD